MLKMCSCVNFDRLHVRKPALSFPYFLRGASPELSSRGGFTGISLLRTCLGKDTFGEDIASSGAPTFPLSKSSQNTQTSGV